MHVLWTPSWYPSPEFPLNGSFFKEQVGMLRDSDIDVGVVWLEPKTFWQWRKHPIRLDLEDKLVHHSFPNVPKGIIPGDYELIRRHATILANEYESRWGKPDVIHAHSVFPGVLVAQILSERWNVPYGITEHRPSTLQQVESTPRYKRIKRAVCGANFRITVSRPIAEKLNEKYGAPFDVCALPVPDSFFERPLPERKDQVTRFVHISGLTPEKRVEETIEAFRAVLDDGTPVRLDIVGGHTSERVEELRKFVDKLGISGAVKLLGPISRDEMPCVLNHDAFVLYSSVEAGGTSFAEAQSLGMIVVGSATFAGKFMITPETGIVVPIEGQNELQNAIKQIATGQVRFQSSRIRDVARHRFSAATFSTYHKKIYQTAIDTVQGAKR